MRIKIIYKIFDHFFNTFCQILRFFCLILFRKSKKYGNYTNQKKNSHRNQYTCSGDLTKVRRKIEKKRKFFNNSLSRKTLWLCHQVSKVLRRRAKRSAPPKSQWYIYVCIRGWLFNVEPIYGFDHLSLIINISNWKKEINKSLKSCTTKMFLEQQIFCTPYWEIKFLIHKVGLS